MYNLTQEQIARMNAKIEAGGWDKDKVVKELISVMDIAAFMANSDMVDEDVDAAVLAELFPAIENVVDKLPRFFTAIDFGAVDAITLECYGDFRQEYESDGDGEYTRSWSQLYYKSDKNERIRFEFVYPDRLACEFEIEASLHEDLIYFNYQPYPIQCHNVLDIGSYSNTKIISLLALAMDDYALEKLGGWRLI